MYVVWVRTDECLYWITFRNDRFILSQSPEEAHQFGDMGNAESAITIFLDLAHKLGVSVTCQIERVAA